MCTNNSNIVCVVICLMFIDYDISLLILFLNKLGCASPSHPNKQISLCFPSYTSTAPIWEQYLYENVYIFNLLLLQKNWKV
nr:MAG TPA: hypothetical protein [Caudoviricetes sp.]